LLCTAGEQVGMQLADKGFTLEIAVLPPSPALGEDKAVDVTVTLTKQGRKPLTQRILVPAGMSGTVTYQVD
jgi:hypothetical protein